MKKVSLILLFIVCVFVAYSQNTQYSRNGCDYSPIGEIRFLVVFADVINDTISDDIIGWNEGELPTYAESIVDVSINGNLKSYISRFYKEASFGNLSIVGDYYPYLVEFTRNNSNFGVTSVISYLDSIQDEIVTKHGYHLSDFDKWNYPRSRNYNCTPNNTPDNKIDMLIVVWRRNINCGGARSGGSCVGVNCEYKIKNFEGINGYSQIYHDDVSEVLRHEFGHCLIGGNSFHTGGAGTGARSTFLSDIGGYSALSSHNTNLDFCNGWDRWWLGWKHSSKTHFISAINSNGTEVVSDIVYGDSLADNEFILRDFATWGDAVRIKLPHTAQGVKNQYLWIENHQIKTSSVENSEEHQRPKGIRFNIQIGNDDLYSFSSQTNYLVPLSSFGNHDYYYDTLDYPQDREFKYRYRASTYSNMENPFTGNHPAMIPAFDYTKDDTIKAKELITVMELFLDNEMVLNNWPVYGNKYDAFPVNSSLSIASNPPSTPLLTYTTPSRGSGGALGSFFAEPSAHDNRYVWLNGLRVDIVKQYLNGNIKVRVVWNDFKVDSNVRWCGPIMLSERVELQPSCTISLDHGMTATRPNNPITLEGQKVFTDPTVFTCRNGSYFKQEAYSTVNVINNSTLVLDSGSVYEINDNAVLNIESSGTLVVKSGATLRVKGRGYVDVKNGGYICVENGATIELVDTLSMVCLRLGSQIGLKNGVNNDMDCMCITSASAINTIGNGTIGNFATDRCIQNTIYSTSTVETGNNIDVGYDVCNPPYGDVIIQNNSNVVIDAGGDVELKNNVEVKQGSSLEVR